MILEEKIGRHIVAYDYAANGSITALVVASTGSAVTLSASGATLESARAGIREAIRRCDAADSNSRAIGTGQCAS